ncbi:hypothetical protein QFC20_003787 [Naganishia adeliensis]|uniref:Uncharacterized protein n=1 Tax=Naganishia adeliensis TaxID=92952 RepID=A0ACC2W825_9TREE|nr:hypothetical protein QFC20_003787 [Naganishia adeliensis]
MKNIGLTFPGQQYTQYIGKNRHTIKRKVKFESEKQWGQIIVFLEFKWQGEDIKVAVIKTYKTRNWFGRVREPPRELLGQDEWLQIVDVDFLNSDSTLSLPPQGSDQGAVGVVRPHDGQVTGMGEKLLCVLLTIIKRD